MKAKGVAAACFVAALWARAADDIENETLDIGGTESAREVTTETNLLRPLGVTLVLIGMAGGLIVLGRRLKSKRPFLRSRNIKILETAYLSQKHTISLVRVRNRILLLGIGQDVRTLASFDRAEDVISFDGTFNEEMNEALKDAPGQEKQGAEPSSFEPYHDEVRSLRKALGKWRNRLKGEVHT